MQELVQEVSEKYDLVVKNMTPYRDAFIVNSSKGKKILKKSSFSAGRIRFVHSAKEHLYNNHFQNIDRYICTVSGEPYMEYNGLCYTVAEFVEGKEFNFDNRSDIINASRLLANMHKSSKGFIPPEDSIARDELGKLPYYFSKRLEEIKKVKKFAQKGKSKFDYLFLEYYDYFYRLGESSINLLLDSKYEYAVKNARSEGILCHHDFTHNNILYGGAGDTKNYIINFEYCSLELKVYDIANFLRRKMRKCNWDINEAKIILDEYKSMEPINEDEFYIMKIMLKFPQKFWRVINKYYNSRRSWSERSYILKLQEVISEIDMHKEFIEKFDSLA